MYVSEYEEKLTMKISTLSILIKSSSHPRLITSSRKVFQITFSSQFSDTSWCDHLDLRGLIDHLLINRCSSISTEKVSRYFVDCGKKIIIPWLEVLRTKLRFFVAWAVTPAKFRNSNGWQKNRKLNLLRVSVYLFPLLSATFPPIYAIVTVVYHPYLTALGSYSTITLSIHFPSLSSTITAPHRGTRTHSQPNYSYWRQ